MILVNSLAVKCQCVILLLLCITFHLFMLNHFLITVKERESSSDSGFEDSPSSPTKLHAEKPNSPSKIVTSKERRERRVQDRRMTNVAMTANMSEKWKEYRSEEEIYRYIYNLSYLGCYKDSQFLFL